MTKGYERAIKLTERIKKGALYTDGKELAEVHKVARLGHIMLKFDDESIVGYGVDDFRANWWLVRPPQEQQTKD